jgi:hypothetical protein
LVFLTLGENSFYSALRGRPPAFAAAQRRTFTHPSRPQEPIPMQPPEENHPETGPEAGTTFSLAPGVRLEPLGDGSAVLYSRDLDQSLSLNHTAALLCSYADGQHTMTMVLQEMSQIFPAAVIDENLLVDSLRDLVARRFLQWS